MTIDVNKLKSDIEAAKGEGEPVRTIIEAVKAEARELRLAGGGGGQQAIDELIARLDALLGAIAPPQPVAKP